MSATKKEATKADVADNKSKATPDILKTVEQDLDEFEEFETLNPDAVPAAGDALGQETVVNVWEDNWDDESAETDFSKQLKEELAKHGHTPAQ